MSEFGYTDEDTLAAAAGYITEQATEQATERATAAATDASVGFLAGQLAAQEQLLEERHNNEVARQLDERMQQKHPDTWENDKGYVGEMIAREPGLIPAAAYTNPQLLESAMDRVYTLAQIESKANHERRQQRETNSFADNLVKQHRRTYASHMENVNVHDVLKGED